MQKREVLLGFIFFIVVSSGIVSAVDVAYVVLNQGFIKQEFISVLNELSLSYDIVFGNEIGNYDFSQARMILLNNDFFTNWNQIPINNYPAVVSNGRHIDEWGWTRRISTLSQNSPITVRMNTTHELSQGFNEIVQVYGSQGPVIYYLDRKDVFNGLEMVSSNIHDNKDLVVALARAGTTLTKPGFPNTEINANTCFFGVAGAEHWTNSSRELFIRCINFVISGCNNDAQCIDEIIGEPYCLNNDVYQDLADFSCANPGTSESMCVDELVPILLEDCDNETETCFQGECIEDLGCVSDTDCNDNNPGTFDECLNPDTEFSECRNTNINCARDSDCGFTGFFGEEFCTADNLTKNFQSAVCVNAGTLNSFCNIQITSEVVQECGSACSNGVCVVCDENSDCDDNNGETEDVCVNPGILNSFCLHEEIVACLSNSDCGQNGFVGGGFCTNNDVRRNFVSFACNNPGTSESFCSNSTIPVLLEDCESACFNGECVAVECFSNVDCNDNNGGTEDSCINAGMPNSFCLNEEIECFSDLDCGVDGFVGGFFCSNENVAQNFETFSCINAGTSNSFCDSDIEEAVIEECEESCFNGICVEGVHDVGFIDFPNSIDRIRIEDLDGNNILNENLMCNEKYKFIVRVENIGNFFENVLFDGDVGGLELIHSQINNLAPGETRQKIRTLNITLGEGFYDVSVEAILSGNVDENPLNNLALREIFVSCPLTEIECETDLDCGIDGFVGGQFCIEDNVARVLRTFSCENPGTQNSFCLTEEENVIGEICTDICVGGECVDVPMPVECFNDMDCDDNNSMTFDQCINAGSVNSECGNTEINCAVDTDCGIDGFVGGEFCIGNNIFKNFQDFMCLNPGELNSACIFDAGPEFIESCEFACAEGGCVECDEDSDCDDNNENTEDVCMMPDSVLSFCENELIEDPLACVNECVENSFACVGNGAKSCHDFDGDGCTEWSPVSACGDGEMCVNGFCV